MAHAEKIIEQANAEREEMQSLLRPVAEFFHSHEGKLFERYEALVELKSDDSVPSNSERTLGRVIGNLAADRVDPVQNIVRDDGKYIGVVEYEEHDYWYEYVEVDDVHGRVNVGVCAKCVSEASSDSSVAKGVGTTEELADRIESHYHEKHDTSVEEVETGATLVSGTTVSGNTAIHSGNDGVGSGLDADTYRGSTNLIQEEVFYSERIISAGEPIFSFPAPGSRPVGLSFDSSESIWIVSDGDSSIYQLNQSGSILSQFASKGDDPEGIDFDSNDSIWHADWNDGSIYKLNQSGSTLSQFATTSFYPVGVGLDSNDSIWSTGFFGGSIYQLDQSGSLVSKIAPAASDEHGVGVDSNDSIWHTDTGSNSIYQLDQSGSKISEFASPSSSPTGIDFDSNDSIWHTDSTSDVIYRSRKYNNIKYE